MVTGPANEKRAAGPPANAGPAYPATPPATPPSGIPAGPDYPQGSPQVGTTAGRDAARALRAAARRAPREIDSASLTIAGGDTVQILCLAELIDWLDGLAVRVEAGEPL